MRLAGGMGLRWVSYFGFAGSLLLAHQTRGWIDRCSFFCVDATTMGETMCAAGDDVCCCTTVGSGVVDGSFIFLRLLLLVDRDICAADAVGSGLDGSFAASCVLLLSLLARGWTIVGGGQIVSSAAQEAISSAAAGVGWIVGTLFARRGAGCYDDGRRCVLLAQGWTVQPFVGGWIVGSAALFIVCAIVLQHRAGCQIKGWVG
eukprot:CAMPEP_0172329222 /NCGR_PEP_ID=MMETSP1058-20130122/60766_1 /TAXON_ID=83371 /ORGANISM="Detonula confervacea, Strain CCMP 353" /LENGTH=202 /DNA_ID=CAMNT_0013046381 /DNA_START=1164 /DNA_END=1769 /DNA_ORIENTATION=+